MSKLRLAYASACDYDRTRSLADGRVQPEGIDLNFMVLPTVEEVFWRTARYQDFDSSEFSLQSYLVAKANAHAPSLPLVAIPVFPSRAFRHSAIFVNRRAGVEKPEDLAGKIVGVPEYQLTAATWVRGILQHEYGVYPEDIHQWCTGGLEQPGRTERVALELPASVKIKPIPGNRTLSDMLKTGDIDALISPRIPSCFLDDPSNVGRLFEDYPGVEQEYYRKTNIFPIMHTVVLKKDVYESNRWIARNLLRAFDDAKTIALEQAYEGSVLKYTMPWMISAIEEQRSTLGTDPWPYGVEQNLETLEALTLYSYEQGLCKRRVDMEELFVPETLGQDSRT